MQIPLPVLNVLIVCDDGQEQGKILVSCPVGKYDNDGDQATVQFVLTVDTKMRQNKQLVYFTKLVRLTLLKRAWNSIY